MPRFFNQLQGIWIPDETLISHVSYDIYQNHQYQFIGEIQCKHLPNFMEHVIRIKDLN